jgi:sirohydrochlorin cobaltochelatase
MRSPGATPHPARTAVVLIGHGAPATDCPPEWVGELMSLEWRKNSRPHEGRGRAEELDQQIRRWPRTASNDPYKTGLEQLAVALQALLPADLLAVGYNEFCQPSIAEAIEGVIREGATRVIVIPSMLTPGGVHAERDIPRALERVRQAHPTIAIEYLWPFDLQDVAALLADHVKRSQKPIPA